MQERTRLRESRNFQEYVQEHRKILKAKSKQPGFASLERILYLVDNGILIRSCQLIQREEVLYSENNITENVDPAFVGICIPHTEETVSGSRWINIINTLLLRSDIFVLVELGSLYSNKSDELYVWSCKRFVSAEPGPDFILPQLYLRSYGYSTQRPSWEIIEGGWCACVDIGSGNEPNWFKKMGKTYVTIAKPHRLSNQRQDHFKVLEDCASQAIGYPTAMAITGNFVKRKSDFIKENDSRQEV